MDKNKIYRVSVTYQLLFLEYSLLSIGIYFLSKKAGMDGITLPLAGGGDDGFFYWNQVMSFLNGGQIIDTSIYPGLISRLVDIVGFNDVFVVRIFNLSGFILLVGAAVLLLRQLTENSELVAEAYKPDTFLRTNLMLGFFFMFYLSLLTTVNLSIYRDVWIYLFYVLSIYLMGEGLVRRKYHTLFLLVPSLILLGGFRTYAVIAFLVATALNLIMFSERNYSKYLAWAVVIFAVYYTFFIDLIIPIVDMSLRDALDFRQSGIEVMNGGSNMHIRLDQPNIILFFLNYLYSFLGNMIGPFPWGINSSMQILVFIMESIPMLGVLFYIFRQRKDLIQNERVVLIYVFVWIAFISLSNDNIGTATRLRATGWIPLVLVFISLLNRRMVKHAVSSSNTLREIEAR